MCFYCKGKLSESTTTHVVTQDFCTIIIKNVPCVRCEQCGEPFFNDYVSEQIEKIVNELQSVVTEIAVVNYVDKSA
jgi:YgiT-type zinc finger domain-containing protein